MLKVLTIILIAMFALATKWEGVSRTSIKIQLDEHTVEDYNAIKILKEIGFTDEEIQTIYDKQKEKDYEENKNV